MRRLEWLRRGEPFLVMAGLMVAVLGTMPDLADAHDRALTVAALAVSGLFGVAFFDRLRLGRRAGRRMVGVAELLDLGGALAVPLALSAGLGSRDARLLGVLWMAGLVRRTSAFRLVGRVLAAEREPLLGVLGAFLVLLFLAVTLAYLLERDVQPSVFGSIPAALWWGIVTITTTGYGDAVPATPTGRILAGLLMVTGIGTFALWAGILANGFGQEIRRREFVRTWELVAQLPLFRALGAVLITEISRLLRHPPTAGRADGDAPGRPGRLHVFHRRRRTGRPARRRPGPSRAWSLCRRACADYRRPTDGHRRDDAAEYAVGTGGRQIPRTRRVPAGTAAGNRSRGVATR